MSKRITILGMGPTAMERRIDLAKYVEGTEVWSLNNAYITYPGLKFDRYFELHGWDYLKTWVAGRRADGAAVDYFYDLDSLDCPVYVSQYVPMVKAQVGYPYMQVFQHFGIDSCYWLGSPSLMLALAIYEHDTGEPVEEIRSWGIDTGDDRHKQQRASWAWWLSKAQDRGIRLTGTALAFHGEHDNDAGLSGLREIIRGQVQCRSQQTDFVVTSAANACGNTKNTKFTDWLDRLGESCKAHNIPFHGWRVKQEGGEEMLPRGEKLDRIEAALDMYKKPVVWIDADDEVTAPFSVPWESDADLAVVKNPEAKVIATELPYGPMAVFYPTAKCREFISLWREISERGVNSHRAMCAAVMAAPEGLRVVDASNLFRGAVRYSASKGRPETST